MINPNISLSADVLHIDPILRRMEKVRQEYVVIGYLVVPDQ